MIPRRSRRRAAPVVLALASIAAACGHDGDSKPPVTFPAFRTCTPPGTRAVVNGGTVGPATAPASCQKPVQASSLAGLQKQTFGTHPVNDVIAFTVPPGTGSVTLVQQAVSAADSITYRGHTLANASVPTQVTAPAGQLLYDDLARPPSDATTAKVWYPFTEPVVGTMTLPNTSAMLDGLTAGTLPSGQWTFQVNDYANECVGDPACTGGDSKGTYDISVLLRPGPVPSTGTVDLAFYVVSSTLTAASAISDAKMTRVLDTLATLYAGAGLCLGKTTFYDVPAWARARYATGLSADRTGPCDDLGQMFTLSRPGENTLNLFLVDDIGQPANGVGGTVVGIEGTIPGPSSIGGTVRSGAVVNLSDLAAGLCGASPDFFRCGADSIAYVLAHEGGHWLGLFHPTDSTGGVWDPLVDTPRCECSTTCVGSAAAARCCNPTTGTYPDGGSCDAQLTFLDGSACNGTGNDRPTCQGADLLMFWLLDGSSQGRVTAQQGAVIRSNPVVQ
jgi:hypothetical protein